MCKIVDLRFVVRRECHFDNEGQEVFDSHKVLQWRDWIGDWHDVPEIEEE